MTISRVLGLVSLILAFGVGLPGAAVAKKVTLTYVGYLAGQPVLDLVATIETPKGADPTAGPYVISADISTSGKFANLYPFRQTMRSEGQFTGGIPAPIKHLVRQTIWSRAYSVALQYGKDGAVSIAATPPTLQSQKAEQEGYANNTVDPASAVVALSALFQDRRNCGARIAVFDGTRRFDLDLAQGETSRVGAMERSFYVGDAALCEVTPTLKAGFQMNALSADLYPRAAKLWLAPAITDFPSVPVRILASNGFGDMVLDLVSARSR